MSTGPMLEYTAAISWRNRSEAAPIRDIVTATRLAWHQDRHLSAPTRMVMSHATAAWFWTNTNRADWGGRRTGFVPATADIEAILLADVGLPPIHLTADLPVGVVHLLMGDAVIVLHVGE